MQLIRGLENNEIRTRVLQDLTLKPFNDVVKFASVLDIAKHESVLNEVNQSTFDDAKMFQINYNNQRTRYNKRDNNIPENQSF